MAAGRKVVCFLAIFLCFSVGLGDEPADSEDVDHADDHEHGEETPIVHLSGGEIRKIVSEKRLVLCLLHKKDCGEKCNQHIYQLEDVMQEVTMANSLSELEVVASEDEEFRSSFAVDDPVLLVFYRNGVPIIYEELRGDRIIHPEEVIDFLTAARDPITPLTDDTFEHLTQAGSGATTGDWFILFHKPSCHEKFLAKWETLQFRLKGKVVLSKVDVQENKEVATRFDIKKCPTFILFRHGKMYEFEQQKHDLDSLAAFATGFYKNVNAKPVPSDKTPFDRLTDQVVQKLKDHHCCVRQVAIGVGVLIIVLAVLRRLTSRKPKTDKTE